MTGVVLYLQRPVDGFCGLWACEVVKVRGDVEELVTVCRAETGERALQMARLVKRELRGSCRLFRSKVG